LVMISISKGIIIRASRAEKNKSLPGNLSREKANAARIVVNNVSATLASVTITELRKYMGNGVFENAYE